MNKKQSRGSKYVLFERKLMRKILSLVFVSICAVFLLRELIRGRFGDTVVGFLTGLFHLDYDDALYIYEITFRNNLETILAGAIIIAIIVVFRYSIRWMTEYFDEISAGCDALLDEKTELITLSPEMGFLELKLNECKNILEKRERDARQAEERKNDLVVYLAHDIRTPLTSVIGYLDLMKEAPDLPVEQRARYLSITLDKAYRLEQLINEFFEITRFNLHSIPLTRENIPLFFLLMQLAEEFYPILTPGGKSVHMDVPENLILPGDPRCPGQPQIDAGGRRVFLQGEGQVLRGVVSQDTPLLHQQHPVGPLEDVLQPVLTEENRHAQLPVDPGYGVQQVSGCQRVQHGGGLVQNQKLRVHGHDRGQV